MRVPTILIVDDHKAVREMLGVVYARAGYAVVAVANGREALDHLASSLVDLIITDLSMPVMGGVELCRAVYGDPRTRAIPLVVLSMTDFATALIDVPIAAVVLKPCTVAQLLETAKALLDQVDDM